MQLGLYEWVYIISEIFCVYTIYKYMEVFFDVRRTKRLVELLSYTAYYIIITLIYLLINIPVILLISNITIFFCLTYNYESTVKKRILSVVLTYMILMIIEALSALLFGSFNFHLFSKNEYASVYGLIVCRILTFLAVLILNNFKNIRKGESVPNSSWLCIVSIPLASLYIALLLFQAEGLTTVKVFAGTTLLFLINFGTFYLYDAIIAAMPKKMQNLPASCYDGQLEMIKAPLQIIRLMDKFGGVFIYEKGDETCWKPLKDILYFESNNNKKEIKMVTHEGEEIFYGKLNDIYRQVAKYHFLYIHKSYVVNYFFVTKFRYDELTMSNMKVLPISQTRRKATRELQIKYEKEGIL